MLIVAINTWKLYGFGSSMNGLGLPLIKHLQPNPTFVTSARLFQAGQP